VPIELAALSESDTVELGHFLAIKFQLPANATLVRHDQMRWKYFEPRPDWPGSRSYVLTNGKKWLAHTCLCPVSFPVPDGSVRACLLVDWVSAMPGAGAEIYRRCAAMMDAVLWAGGSTSAHKTVTDLGYPVRGEIRFYSRPLKPWKLYQQRGAGFGKQLLRLGRDIGQGVAPLHDPGREWSCWQVDRFTDEHAAVCAYTPSGFVQPFRSPELLNYFLRCPATGVSGYEVRRGGEVTACFVLTEFDREVRIADVRVGSEAPGDWAAVVALATRVAGERPAPLMLVPAAVPVLHQALEANRFRCFERQAMHVQDPGGRLGSRPMHFCPFDGDHAYL
jgi:hypothetical protein